MKKLNANILKDMTSRLVKEFSPEKIILFGSHAWGNPNQDSDLDMMVVVSDSDERPSKRAQRAYRCLRGINVPKDILVKTSKEINKFIKVKASLEAEVMERGKVLYG